MRHTATILAAIALLPSTARAEPWRPPVPGPVTRGFEPGPPYAGGHHRGADFEAAPGEPVRAACGGRVVVARTVGSAGRVVTVRCGPWRVTHMPLGAVAVREGDLVASGAPIGTAAATTAHAGLHLGARREGRELGYADPLRFIGTSPVAPLARAPRPRSPARPSSPRGARPGPVARPVQAPDRAPGAVAPGPPPPVPALVPAGSSPAPAPLAPWPAWLGLALLLAGAAGGGSAVAGRRRAASRPRAVPRPVAERVR